MQVAVSPHFELFFALAAALGGAPVAPFDPATARWLNQGRRKVEQGLRRRLGGLAEPAVWIRFASLPRGLPKDDVAAVIDGLAEALNADGRQAAAVDALRRFDRIAFAGLWRSLRTEFEDEAARLRQGPSARLAASLGLDLDTGQMAGAIFMPTRFAPRGFHAMSKPGRGAVALIPLRPEWLERPRRRPLEVSPDPALAFRALGDATRYGIAGLIARAPMTGAELARRLGTSTPTITHHLKLLRQAGLVREEARGNSIVLSLDRAAVERISDAAVRALFETDGEAPILRSRRR
jgi:DNA-binding transcriptional ArsR family regulator